MAPGATDISGTPPPVRTRSPQQIQGDTQKRVNQNRRGPDPNQQQQQQQNPLQELGGEVAQKAQQGAQWARGHGMGPVGDVSPIDWGNWWEQDASSAYGFARQAYKTLTGSYSDGVTNLFGAQDARSRMLRNAVTPALAVADPMFMLQQLGTAAANRQDYQQQQQALQQGTVGEIQGLPQKAADAATMTVAPETLPAKAAAVGVPFAQQVLQQQGQDDISHALFWAAVGASVSFLHIPPQLRKTLTNVFQDWPVWEKLLQGAVEAKRQYERVASDPNRRTQYINDWIQEQLSRGHMTEEFGKVLAKARKPDEPVPIPAYADPKRGGQIVMELGGSKATKDLLARIGVEDVDALVHKIATEGIYDPKLVKQIIDHWKDLGLPYDLMRYHPEEMELRDPRRLLDNIEDSNAAKQHLAAVHHYLDQIHRGLFANHAHPFRAVFRALAGHNRTTTLTHQQYITSVAKLLGEKRLTQEFQELVMKAAEGDQDVYDKLPPEAQMVVDGWGLMRAAEREERAATGVQNVVPNYVPRTDRLPEEMMRGRGRPSRASILAKEAMLHREESLQLGPSGRLVVGQRYKTVQETNRSMDAARKNLVGILTNPQKALSTELQNDVKAMDIWRLARTDPAEAQKQAVTLAAQKYADKETNFLVNVNRVMANQVRSTHTMQALDELTQMRTWDQRAAAIKLIPGAKRQEEEFLYPHPTQDYEHINDKRFDGYVFHPDLAKDLNRYVNHVGKGLRDTKWNLALKLEGGMVGLIMFSPVVHGLNIAGRMGMAAMMNPIEMAHYLLEKKAILPHQWDDISWSKRAEAFNSGFVPHYRGQTYSDNLHSNMGDAVGDLEDQMPHAARPDTRQNRLKSVTIDPLVRGKRGVNNYFWGMVNDFGVMMYHLEKQAALKNPLFTGGEAAAREYAARRANSWAGVVMPEDTNPMVHDLSRLVMFAPNWWRTWAELLVPFYKRAGFREDANYARYAAYQSAKTIMAAFAFQKLTGNAFNLFLSGHLQNENQPGNQDKVEISQPWLLHGLKEAGILPASIDPETGIDPKTGGRYTIENPWARQQQATEEAMGLQSGQSDYQIGDLSDGMTRFLASRLSPMMTSLWGGLNVDLYQSVHDQQLRAVNPMQHAFSLSPANALYSILMAAPNGQEFAQEVNQQAASGDPTPLESTLGTRLPRSLSDFVGDVKDQGLRFLFQSLLGTNPAYETSHRSRGLKPSDQDYQRVRELNDDYQKQMNQLSTETLNGQQRPDYWLQHYQELSRAHAAAMEALFKGSPEYTNGGEGMAARWESLYSDPRVLQKDGSLDFAQLANLQAQFRTEYTPDQLRNMDALLAQNDTKYPMLKLYHQTKQKFNDWQAQWAVQNNVDVTKIRKEASEYGALYGNNQEEQKYLREHPELREYEYAKRSQWERTIPGITWLSFYGQSAGLLRALRARHLTEPQFIQQQAPGPARTPA